MKNAQRGNILFLILLAVILFAALSYAVTQSMRGGKNASSEDAQATAAMILNHITDYQQIIQRQKMIGDYHVIPDTSAPTTSGTCYDGATAITPCKTIGLFSPQAGGHIIPLESIPTSNPAYPMEVVFYIERAGLNDVDIGTSSTDITMWIDPVSAEVCDAFNNLFSVATSAVSYTERTPGPGESIWFWEIGDTTPVFNTNPAWEGTNYGPNEFGCANDSWSGNPYYSLYAILGRN